MDNYNTIQAIQGLLNDFKERFYFQGSNGSKETWDERRINEESNKVIENILKLTELE